MPTAPVDDQGTVLFYDDTGAPPGSTDYLTVILIHGLTFHGEIYKRLLPFAASSNLRFVRLNLRDNGGSSAFTPAEFSAMTSADIADQAAVVKRQGHELAAFLQYFVKNNNIPKVQEVDGKRKGGVAVLTWSMGNIVAFSFLAHAKSLPAETRDLLAQYLRTIVLYDPSNATIGNTKPEGVYHPLRDTQYSLRERGEMFIPWVSEYFEPVPSLSTLTLSHLVSRKARTDKISSVSRMTPEELESMIDRDILERSAWTLLGVSRDVFKANVESALFDTDGVWDRVNALWVWCDESMPDCIWASKTIADRAKEVAATGETLRRKLDFLRLKGANHFPHWDQPDRVIEVFKTCL